MKNDEPAVAKLSRAEPPDEIVRWPIVAPIQRIAAALVLGLAMSAAQAQGTTTVTRTVTYDYDSTTGQLIRTTVEPDTSALRLVTDFARDPVYGVETTRTLSWQDPATNTAKTRTVSTLQYDTRKRYATSSTNAKGHTEVRTYDEGSGRQTGATDPNQLATTWQFDGWGRKTRESRPDGTTTTLAYRKCINTCSNASTAVTIAQNFAGALQTTVPTEAFTDSLGREVLTRTWGFDGTEVLTETVYGANGRLSRTSIPRFTGASAVWIEYFRDELGRVTEQREPDATGGGFYATTTAYNGLLRTVTNAASQTRTERRNALGALNSVIDAAGKTTSYLYDPFGNLVRTRDPAGNQIQVGYDVLGRKTLLADPDLGTATYSVDPLGQTWRQVDAKTQTTTFSYDDLGRLTRRVEADLDSNWEYDSAANGIGLLAETYTLVASIKDYRRTIAYDAASRISVSTVSLDWDYTDRVLYDSFGRAYRHEYRRNVRSQGSGTTGPYTGLVTAFNAYGHASQLSSVGSDSSNTVLWTSLAHDALGRSTKARMGNGLNRQRIFNAYTGRLERINSGPDDGSGGAAAVQQGDVYIYDNIGNLSSRTHLISNSGSSYAESFTYDALNRLTMSTIGATTKTNAYDDVGNLVSMAGATYSYPPMGAGSVRPHAQVSITGTVAGVTNPSFAYDANGNLTDGLNRHYTWTSFNQARVIDRLSAGSAVERTEFVFGTEHDRIRQAVSPVSGGSQGAATRTIHYAGVVEKETDVAANTTTIRTYLPAELGFVQETIAGINVAATSEATRVPRYTLSDRLGSAIAVVDSAQSVLQRMSYDPWGRRRNANGTDDASAGLGGISNTQDHTGYTGQEQLDQLALVHLNGRIYDPITARMLSADPTVPDPANAQALNRYSYALNNALAYMDPSGFEPTPPGDRPGAPGENPHVPDTHTLQKTPCSLSVGGWCAVVWVNQSTSVVAQNQDNTKNGTGEVAAKGEGGGFFSNVGERFKNLALGGMFKTDAQMDAWGAGFQAAQQLGPEATAEFLRNGNLPGMWMKDAAAVVVTAGASSLPAVARSGAGESVEIAAGKFDYLFGRVSSNAHNAARSNQLALEMKRLGVPDTAAGRQMLSEHLALSARAEGNVVRTFSNQYGKFEVRESLFMGPSGKAANFQSTFQVLEDGARRLSTIIPLH